MTEQKPTNLIIETAPEFKVFSENYKNMEGCSLAKVGSVKND
tara:strand:- start:371 stop:496 length:126 start_codon:yes stop_codon:yes gene_type:complete